MHEGKKIVKQIVTTIIIKRCSALIALNPESKVRNSHFVTTEPQSNRPHAKNRYTCVGHKGKIDRT